MAGGDDAGAAGWHPVEPDNRPAPLAFDHDEILRKGRAWFESFDGINQAGLINS